MKIKVLAIIALVLIIALFTSITIIHIVEASEEKYLDDVAHFNHAIIFLHNGEMIEGELDNWGMVNDSVIQVVIEGHTYRTSYNNVILSDEGE